MADIFTRLSHARDFSIEEIVDASAIDADHHSLLQEAIVYRRDLIKDILLLDIPINNQDLNGSTALHYAISRSDSDTTFAILEKGGDPNLCDKHGNNALWTAILRPSPDLNVIKSLLSKGANAFLKNRVGKSALDAARMKNRTDIIDLILNNIKKKE